jgi:hypothetical protein
LGSTYVLNQGALVLEGVTLGGVVQLVVKVLVDLATSTVLDQEATEDTLATHPEDLPVVCQVSPWPPENHALETEGSVLFLISTYRLILS